MEENKKIERVLNSLQGIQQPEANSFMLTRILAKAKESDMERTTIWYRIFEFLQKPTIAFSLIVFVLTLNFFFLYNNSKQGFDLNNNTASAVMSKADFNMEFKSIYDIENSEQ
jgi:preprotein translocase subunit SecG